ncbi:hypothetical protein [Sphingomonas natans]|nr:hypothetical protein [Sphingomonas sp. BIUV-7]
MIKLVFAICIGAMRKAADEQGSRRAPGAARARLRFARTRG